MKIGGHAVLFKEKISTDTEWVLKGLHDAGAEIVELGARFFGVEKADELNAALGSTGMELGGVHASKKLPEFVDDCEGCREYLISVAEFVSRTSCRRIIMTGGCPDAKSDDLGDARLSDTAFVRKIAENIDRLACEIWETYGIRICYHNHSYEFRPSNMIYESLIRYAPHLWFALDIGWAGISGYDPELLIDRLAGRIDYLHLRDFRNGSRRGMLPGDFENEYVPLGEGDLGIRRVLDAFIRAAGDSACAVVEYEKGEEDFDRYRKAIAYVRSLLS